MKISRRDFLKKAVTAASALGFLKTIPAAFGRVLDKPIFTFLQITDFHLGSYGQYERGMEFLTGKIRNEVDFALPDFILATGDLADKGEAEQYNVFRKYMDTLGVPYYAIPGNHYDGGYKNITDNYLNLIGKDKLNYDFTFKGMHFIMLARYNTDVDWRWLDALISSTTLPVIISDHYPIYPVRTDGRATSYKMGGTEITEILNRYSSKIIAFLTGHSHVNSLIKKNDVFHIGTQAIVNLPNSFRHYSVYQDRIEVKTHYLQKEAGKYFWWGWYQWENTDELHPTVFLYNFGNENERYFTIPVSLTSNGDTVAPTSPKNVKVIAGQ